MFTYSSLTDIFNRIAKYPNPGSSGKNWSLGAAGYVACWFAWIFIVFLTYELVYSFVRRWRLRMFYFLLSTSEFLFIISQDDR